MDGTMVFLLVGVASAVAVFALHCKSYSRGSCNAVLRGAFSKGE